MGNIKPIPTGLEADVAAIKAHIETIVAAGELDVKKAESWFSKNWLSLLGHAGSIGSIWAFAKHWL